MRIPLDYTYVSYSENDFIGLCLAFITLTPIYAMVMYATLILFRRDYGTCYTLGGQIFNLLINKLLKRIINQPRPMNCEISSDSGMPSNHAQFMSYLISFYIFQIAFNSKYLTKMYKLLYILILLLIGITVCYSRIYLNYHTIDQVVVGVIIGSILGIIWSAFDCLFGNTVGDIICEISIIKYFNIINYSPLFEYLHLRKQKVDYIKNKKS
jgi:dolichyldiphosphatase